MRLPPDAVRRTGAVLATLAAGSLGGLVFAGLGLPAPWISGALIFTLILALTGVRIAVPEILRFLAFVVLGASMGAVLTPQMLAQAAAWPLSMACLALSIAATMAGSILFLTRVAGWSLATAFYAAAPGAFSTVVAMAEETDADLRQVAFAQTVRLFLLVAVLPSALGAAGLAGTAFQPPAQSSPPLAVALLLAVAMAGGLVAERIRLPGGLIIGALAASGALHLSELSDAVLPPELLEPAFVILGAGIGVRFLGTTLGSIKEFFLVSLGAFLVAIAIAAVFAAIAMALTGTEFGMLLSAFAPGGLEAMTALGFALGYDPVFMSAHHLFRFTGLSVALPLLAYLLFGARISGTGPAPAAASCERKPRPAESQTARQGDRLPDRKVED